MPSRRVRSPVELRSFLVGFSACLALFLLWSLLSSTRRVQAGVPSRRPLTLCSGAKLLPSLFLIGGTKTGTTSLFNALKSSVPSLQPGLALGREADWAVKEKFFWNIRFKQGRLWYLEVIYTKPPPSFSDTCSQHYPRCPHGGTEPREGEGWDVSHSHQASQIAVDFTANLFISPEATPPLSCGSFSMCPGTN